MIVHFFTGIFEHIPEIRQFKVVQKSVDRIEIRYIPDNGFTPSVLESVERQIRKRLNEPLPVDWVLVDNIPPSGSGKPQLVESCLPNAPSDTPIAGGQSLIV